MATNFNTTTGDGVVVVDGLKTPKDKVFGLEKKMYPDTVIFGDSITEQNGDVTANGYRFLTSHGYFSWANFLSGAKMNLVKNAGIPGNTTSQMRARIKTDVLAYNPDLVIMLAGTNDIANGVSSSPIKDNLKTMYDMILSTGCTLVVCTILPRVDFNTAGEKQALWEVNNFIKDYAVSRSNCILCDWYSTIVDSDGVSVRDNMTRDGIHPTILGAYRKGAKLASVLNFSSSVILSTSPDDKRNLLTNGILAGDVSGRATGWLASNVATATFSKDLVDDGVDYHNKQVINYTDDTQQVDFYQEITGNFSPGDVIQGIATVELSNITSIKMMEISVRYNGLTGLGRFFQIIPPYDASGFPTTITGGVLKTPKLVVPDGATSLRYFFSAKMIGTAKLSHLTLFNFSR